MRLFIVAGRCCCCHCGPISCESRRYSHARWRAGKRLAACGVQALSEGDLIALLFSDDSGEPFCAEFKTGKVMWKRKGNDDRGEKSAAVTYADGRLYFHYVNGPVSLVKASPDAYEEVGSFQAPKRSGPSRAHPVVSDGRLYLREGDMLYCYDVRAKK